MSGQTPNVGSNTNIGSTTSFRPNINTSSNTGTGLIAGTGPTRTTGSNPGIEPNIIAGAITSPGPIGQTPAVLSFGHQTADPQGKIGGNH